MKLAILLSKWQVEIHYTKKHLYKIDEHEVS
jgi:hypothetical protein